MTIIETFYKDQIGTSMVSDMFTKEVIYDSEKCVVIRWVDVDRIVVYIPKNKEKDLSRLPECIKERITKEML